VEKNGFSLKNNKAINEYIRGLKKSASAKDMLPQRNVERTSYRTSTKQFVASSKIKKCAPLSRLPELNWKYCVAMYLIAQDSIVCSATKLASSVPSTER